MHQLYKNIKNFREEKNMSQTKLAELTGYTHRSSITKIEKGEVDLSLSKIEQFAEVFGKDPGDLVGWEEDSIEGHPIEENLTKENAKLIPDILSDFVLTEHVKKLMKLNAQHKNTIYDNIDYWYEKEGH